MKCKYCGGNLDLEHKFCPHCGRPNELADQHIRDMERFQGEFDETKKDVYRNASRWSGIFARSIILAVIVILIFLAGFVSQNAWSFRREHLERDAERHYAEYSAELNRYLEKQDYRGFVSCMNYHYMDSYGSPYMKYSGLKRAADYYSLVLEYVMRIAMPASYLSFDQYYESLSNDLDQFYRFTDPASYDEYDQIDLDFVQPHWERMEQTIQEVLRTYLHFSEEEVGEFRAMSKARRSLLLEEKIKALQAADAADSAE